MEIDRPLVMGIINLTADSFYADSRTTLQHLAERAAAMLADGADILDLGACSTRPDAVPVDEETERKVLTEAVRTLRKETGDCLISVDTFRASVATECVECGADIINDVSGGSDPSMFETVAVLKVPYVLTHSRGDSMTMQNMTDYGDVAAEVLSSLAFKTDELRQAGVTDVIVDPGFGFAKTLDQNYRLLSVLEEIKEIGAPVLAGVSRKSMIYKELGCTPEEALNGTTALNMIALMNGADIIRVHDVKEARETVMLYQAYRRNKIVKNQIFYK